MKLGVLGGTFDPLHLGHIELALAARELLGLDEVHLVPCRQSPHKDRAPLAPGADRLAMIALGVMPHQGLVPDSCELDRPAPSFTIDTLRMLAAQNEGTGLKEESVFKLRKEVMDKSNSYLTRREFYAAAVAGAREAAERLGIPVLGDIPINVQLRLRGDEGATESIFDDAIVSVMAAPARVSESICSGTTRMPNSATSTMP